MNSRYNRSRHTRRPSTIRNRKGAILPLVAIMLPIFILLAAFIVNIAYMELARTELQISADAAARAGGRTYANVGDVDIAREKARELAARNTVAGSPLLLHDDDFDFGVSTRTTANSRYDFNSSNTQFNALRVNARRTDGSLSGPVGLLLPNLLGVNEVESTMRATSTQVELDIAIIVDRSGSMAYADNENSNTFNNPASAPVGWKFGDAVPNPSRWVDTEAAVAAFLAVLGQTPQTELVSLTTYGDSATLDVELTGTYFDIEQAMRAHGSSFQEALTNIGGGIDAGRTSLATSPAARPFASKFVVVLTDGIHNSGTNPNSAARRAANNGAIVHTVTFSNEANQSRMNRVAQIGNGKHFHAVSGAQLVVAFEEIAKSLPTMIVE